MVLTPLITYIKPDNFDWEIFKQIKSDVGTLEDLQSRRHHDTTTTAPIEEEEKAHDDERHDQEINARLLVARKKAGICCVVLCLSFCILWPIPMYATDYVFSKPFFRGWIVVVYLWAFFAAITITCYPVWEGRASIARFFRYATGRSPVVAQSTSNPSSVIEGVFVRGHESEDVRYESEVPVKIG